MLSLDSLLKKTRCNFSELPSSLYGTKNESNVNNIGERYDPEEYGESVDHLFFREHYQVDSKVLQKELDNMKTLHNLMFETYDSNEETLNEDDEKREEMSNHSKNSSDLSEQDISIPYQIQCSQSYEEPEILYPMHPFIQMVHFFGRVFTAYNLPYNTVFVPNSATDIKIFLKKMLKSLHVLHGMCFYVSNISPDLFVWNGIDIDTLTFSPSITNSMKPAQLNNKTSIILGTNCVSPFQILWDMLHSKSEQDIIEYSEFKKKFQMFWEGILKPEYKFVPKICQKVYGDKTGLDYINFILNRWCKTFQTKSGIYIQKDPQKMLTSSYFFLIDYFGLGIQVIRYIELLKVKGILKNPEVVDLKDIIYDFITMSFCA